MGREKNMTCDHDPTWSLTLKPSMASAGQSYFIKVPINADLNNPEIRGLCNEKLPKKRL